MKFSAGDISNVVKVDNARGLTTDDCIIVVMGSTGAGKSTFIQTVADGHFSTNEVSHRLSPATKTVTAVRFTFTNPPRTNLVLIDTPGIDDAKNSDLRVLNLVAEWLNQGGSGTTRRISGILYLHPITNVRTPASISKNFEMFARLCGEDFFSRVILVSTMWPEDCTYFEECKTRERNFHEDYWKLMIDLGSKVLPFYETVYSAEVIINTVIEATGLLNTRVWKRLYEAIEGLRKRQDVILELLREEVANSAIDDGQMIRNALFSALHKVQEEIGQAIKDLQQLHKMTPRVTR